MSAAIIEMLIQEALRDGSLSQAEIDSIYKEAESLGVSKGLVDSLIDLNLTKTKAEAEEKEQKERLKREKDRNRKYEVFEMTFEKLVREWIGTSKSRVLDKDDYMPDLRREAKKWNIELSWLDAWVEKLEKSEQEIAGIKPSAFGKLKNIFKK